MVNAVKADVKVWRTGNKKRSPGRIPLEVVPMAPPSGMLFFMDFPSK